MVVAAYLAAFFPWSTGAAPWLLCLGMAVLLPSLLWLGVVPTTLRGYRVRVVLVLTLFLVLLAGLGGALLPGSPGDEALVLGLPRRAAWLLYGVGLFPGLLLGIIYAIGFRRLVLDPARLEALRRELNTRTDPR